MNGIPLLVFGAVILTQSPAAHAAVRPECEEWQAKARTVVDLDSEKKSLLPGKTKKDLITVLEAYPDEASFTVERNGKTAKQAIQDYLGHPGCKSLTYWSIHRWALTEPSFDRNTRRKILQEVMDRTLRELDGEPSQVTLVTRVQLLMSAAELGVLEIGDDAYFALSRLLTETDRLRANTQAELNYTIPEGCLNLDKIKTRACDELGASRMFDHFQREARLTTALRRELVRWLKRVAH